MIILKSVRYDNVLEIAFSYNIMNWLKGYLDIIAREKKKLKQTLPLKLRWLVITNIRYEAIKTYFISQA